MRTPEEFLQAIHHVMAHDIRERDREVTRFVAGLIHGYCDTENPGERAHHLRYVATDPELDRILEPKEAAGK